MKQKEHMLQKNIRLFNKWAASYDNPLFQFWMKRFHTPVLQEIDFSKKQKIVDLSCGTGELLKEISKRNKVGSELHGIDIAEKMLNVAKRKVPEALFKIADVHNLPFKDNTFDIVMCTEAFHHYYDQTKAIQEMVRVVKKDGKVIIVDINFFFKWIHWLFQKLESGNTGIVNRKEMHQLFKQNNLRDVKQWRCFLFAVATKGVK